MKGPQQGSGEGPHQSQPGDRAGASSPFAFVRLDWPEQLPTFPNHVINDDDFRQVRAHYGATPTHHDSQRTRPGGPTSRTPITFSSACKIANRPAGLKQWQSSAPSREAWGGCLRARATPLHQARQEGAIERTGSVSAWGRAVHVFGLVRREPACPAQWVVCPQVSDHHGGGGRGGTGHWATVIFDRYTNEATDKMPHLYILDPDVSGRGARLTISYKFGVRCLREVGYPAHFMAYILPLTNRPADWTTPYIALFSGIQAMRGLSGDRITCMTSIRKNKETLPLLHGTGTRGSSVVAGSDQQA